MKSLSDIWNSTPEVPSTSNTQVSTGGSSTTKSIGEIWNSTPSEPSTTTPLKAPQITVPTSVADLPGATISQAPEDNRPFDTTFKKVIRAITPKFLEKELGIAPEQVQPAPLTPGEEVKLVGDAQTKALAEKNPEEISWQEYLKRGLSFGNELDPTVAFSKTDEFSVRDLPEPTTTGQKIAQAVGNLLTMTAAQPFIGAALNKIPLVGKIATAEGTPWSLAKFLTSVGKAGVEGGLFGLITKNNKTVAENTLETAGAFAAFQAIAYPITAFFKPILESVGTGTIIPENSKNLINDALNSIKTQETSRTLWFRNPENPSQILKVTAKGLTPATRNEVVEAGLNIRDLPKLTKVEIEAFKENPSIYARLKDWLKGKLTKGIEVPFDAPPTAEEIPTITKELNDVFSPAQGEKTYPTIHEGGVIKMVKGEPVEIIDGVDTFIHEGDGGWVVSESTTGRFISDSRTKDGAIAKAKFNINEVGKEEFTRLLEEKKLPPAEKITETPEENTPIEVAKVKTYIPQSGKVPDYMVVSDPATASFVDSVKPAQTPEELAKRIEQLNKFAQANAILRRTGGLPKTAAGIFRGEGQRGNVRLQDYVVSNLSDYMSTLAHELGHAMEHNLVGKTNVDTRRVFGKNINEETWKTIKSELKEITNKMVGEEIAKKGAGYYYKETELLARFLQRMFESPGDINDLAPTALEFFERSALENPIIQEYLDAVYNKIDKGAPKFIFLRDMRQTYEKHLGKRVGDIVWKEEVAYRAMKERAKIVIEKMLKEKFKGIKDTPDQLFRAAESIKITKGGIPEFGTRNFANAKTLEEELALKAQGWEPLIHEGTPVYDFIEGKEYPRFAQTRYTPEEAERIFRGLSPEGQQLILDFTSSREEAKDLFNREVIKSIYKVEGHIEGWVHHFFDEEIPATLTARSKKFKIKKAGGRIHRTGSEGYVEDLKKAMTKALTEFETEKVWNEFIDKQFARVTKPIAKGEQPDPGYVEVVGNLKRGVGLPQESRMTIIQDGKAVPVQQTRYQMPKEIYARYKLMGDLALEASKATRFINSLNRYWRINILFHPGSAATNFISGGIQYSSKILTDFYTEVLTGSVKFEKTRRNIFSMITVLTPKGWQNAPDWMYGGDLSNYYGQFGRSKAPGILDKGVDKYAEKTLKFYGSIERYWKKVIATAERAGDLKKLEETSLSGLRLPTAEEQKLIDEINREIDLFAYDYDNVPMWLENFNQHPLASAIKPFLKYPYKMTKQLTDMIGSAFDRTQPWQERMAKILAIGTIISIYAYISAKRKEEQRTPELGAEELPPSLSTRGRLFVGREGGKELFVRTAKYPFFNVTDAGMQFIEGHSSKGFEIIADMIGSIAPVGQIALGALGYRNKFQQYTPAPVLIGDALSSFVPGTRILQDVARYFDPYQRQKETFGQSFTSLIPLPSAPEDVLEKFRGSARSIRVPLEGNIKSQPGESTRRTTTDQTVLNYQQDILLSFLTGIYVSRIDPDVVKAFETRNAENAEKAAKK